MTPQEELSEFIGKLDRFSSENCPKFITPNSNWFGVEPGHNLDLLKIAFDYRVDRTFLLRTDFTDPSKPRLEVVK